MSLTMQLAMLISAQKIFHLIQRRVIFAYALQVGPISIQRETNSDTLVKQRVKFHVLSAQS